MKMVQLNLRKNLLLKYKTIDGIGIKMHVPTGYIPETPTGFFSRDYDKAEFERFCNIIAQEKQDGKHNDNRDNTELCKFLTEHLDRIDEVAYDVGILDNNSKLLIYGLYHKVIKFQTKLDGLFYPDIGPNFFNRGNHLMRETGNNIFMITGLDQEIQFGGVKLNITNTELIPVCNLATFCMDLYTHASDKLVTCYSVDLSIINLFSNESVFSIGRFRFRGGMCEVSP
jgi:hypothetical protein